MRKRTTLSNLAVFVAVAAVLLAAGCGGTAPAPTMEPTMPPPTSAPTVAPSPTPEEMETVHHWVADKFDAMVPELPFSFSYGGQSSREFLKSASQARWT